MTVSLPATIADIQRLLPHRYPFLLVDRVVALEPHKRVLVVEALAQAGGLLTQLSKQDGDDMEQLFYLVKVDNAKFSRMVVPGDRLDLDVELKRQIRNMAQYVGVARVDGEQVACAEILCAAARA